MEDKIGKKITDILHKKQSDWTEQDRLDYVEYWDATRQHREPNIKI